MTYSEWIRANRKKFLDEEYTLREVINLSFAVGWKLSEMKPVLRHWPRALWVTDPEAAVTRVAKMEIETRLEGHKIAKCLSLKEQWSSLKDYQLYGKEWERKSA